jgi:hypothetical protein
MDHPHSDEASLFLEKEFQYFILSLLNKIEGDNSLPFSDEVLQTLRL